MHIRATCVKGIVIVICVLDASITLAWLLPGELTDPIQIVFDGIVDKYAFVPALWKIEVANGLSSAIRRKRITLDSRDKFIQNLVSLPILDDTEGLLNIWSTTLSLSDFHKLTVYDATYLELALRRSLPLATLDQDLRRAAQAEGIPLLGL